MATNGVQGPKAPEWLKPELFESVLKEADPNYVKICNFNVRNATTPGENYATQILRIETEVELKDGRNRTLSFVLKVPVHSNQFGELMKMMRTFDKEEGMYTKIVPELEQLYRDAGMDVKFSCQWYNLPAPNDSERLLLEDLAQRGFKNVNRIFGLDMEHTKRVLQKMAQWHAASAVRVETKGKYEQMYSEGNFIEALKPVMRHMLETTSHVQRRCMLSYAGVKNWIDSVDSYRPHVSDELFKAAKVDPNEFNVLNHGDSWSNNIMFQYDAFDKIKDVCFVDFQLPKYGTPAQDLYYFLLSSTQYDIKIKHFDFFIKYYHDNLIENLKLLKYAKPLPKLKQLHQALHKYSIWGYSTVTGVMAAVLVEPTDSANLDNFVSNSADGTAFKMLMYSNSRYRQHMEALLPWLQNRGALEY